MGRLITILIVLLWLCYAVVLYRLYKNNNNICQLQKRIAETDSIHKLKMDAIQAELIELNDSAGQAIKLINQATGKIRTFMYRQDSATSHINKTYK